VNQTVYDAARRAGCPPREAEVLAWYVQSPKMAVAAHSMGISQQTAKNYMTRILLRFDAPHAAAAVAKVLAG
jgi:DNA-binding CsgD family transcriptional regulator